MKNRKILRLMAALLAIALALCACGGEGGGQTADNGTDAAYQVTVKDAAGNPYTSGVIVRFLSGAEQAGMEVVDANGTATKTLPKGEYTVDLVFTGDDEPYYDKSDLILTADKTSLEIVLAYTMGSESDTLYVGDAEKIAYHVSEGSTYVTLTAGERNYFLFTPVNPGTYEFTSDGATQIAYYGAPHFVQSSPAVEVTDNVFTISVSAGMVGGNVFVLGVDAGEADHCILSILRIGEPEHTIEDEPWMIYEPTVKLTPYTLPAGSSLKDFDLTAEGYTLVLNESDGFYHLNTADGPLVLVYLGEDCQYLDCFKTILEHSGVVKYFFDDNGDFMKKESYTECLLKYIENMDGDNGVYPLTEDLKYIIQQRGEYSGWFEQNEGLYLFKDENGNMIPGINPEISWLFMCCYIAQ